MKYPSKVQLAPSEMIKLRNDIGTNVSTADILIHREKCIDIRYQHNSPLIKGARGISWLCEVTTKKPATLHPLQTTVN